ncbi:MAG: hypothetical protein IE916_05500 [Epsilonproteobacteria bacterium]|nr:hypothetical protein [Campylobacterota bacterium]
MLQKSFMKTGMTHIETTQILVDKLQSVTQNLLYNLQRYHVPTTLVLIYTEEDISRLIEENKRLSDINVCIPIGSSYFNFIYLTFTEEEGGYAFIKALERKILTNVDHLLYFDGLVHENHNCYNFINSFLFNIEKQQACKENGDICLE